MKIVSWNVNGIRSAIKSGLFDFIKNQAADVYLFQEVKISQELLENLNFDGYTTYCQLAEKKGYSGVLVLTKEKPLALIEGTKIKKYDLEGRVLGLEFSDFVVLNVYFPHARRDLTRMDFKLEFDRDFQEFVKGLGKPVIIGGDLNVAHKEIDLAHPKRNEKNPGFTIEEKTWFDNFLKSGFTDTFRIFTKDGGHYTWWSNFSSARQRNVGWRIDYFVVSDVLKERVKNSYILPEIMGSDHAPIVLDIAS